MRDSHKYFKLESKLSDLRAFSEKGMVDIKSSGLSVLDEYFMLKKGYPVFIGGAPFSGKTEFTFEILVNTSILYNWKHFIYCGEGGNIEHIYSELIHKYLGKPYKFADQKERLSAEYFISEHFVVANHDVDFTIDDFYNTVKSCENDLGWIFDTTLFDPFNDIVDESANFNFREDKFIADVLKKVRISSKNNNRIDFIINHIADVRRVKDEGSGQFYMPPAMPNEWAGGRTWWRRAFTMLLVYRYPTFIQDENGRNYESNETQIFIQKSKPKGIGKIGRAPIFYDWKKNRYYCYKNGQQLYSCEKLEDYAPKKLAENKEFLNEDKIF